jgi:beta-galactosidase
VADSEIARHDTLIRATSTPNKWAYDLGFLAYAINALTDVTGDEKYFNYVKTYMDYYINPDGTPRYYKREEYSLERLCPGLNLFSLWHKTGDEKYKICIRNLIEQLKTHPRTSDSCYWHKKIYPYQMWLDGIYVTSPFMVQYAAEFNEPIWFDEAARQITRCYQHTLDKKTGLLFHAWDESREQKWSDPQTGQSPHFWSRAIGWYMMALVDVLEFLPENHSERQHILTILNDEAAALLRVRDNKTALWYQVPDLPNREGNYLEESGSAMFAYSFAKGAKKGYLPASYLDEAKKTYQGIVDNMINTDEKGLVNIEQICAGAGLGGNPYRNGSFEYYVTEKIKQNDAKGVAPFILLCIELTNECYSQHPARKSNFDFDWKFSLKDVKEAASPDYNDSGWEDVQLPHDWSIALPFDSAKVKDDGQWRHTPARMGFLPGGIGWYRKTFYMPVEDKDKKTTILFDGVYHQCEVYINGKSLGFHPYGYIGFEYDLTPYLKYGAKNTLSVRVDHSNAPSSRWYSGSGIYRHVWLTVTNPVRVATWGTYITTPQITASSAEVKIVTTIENNTSSPKNVLLESRIVDAKGNIVATTSSPATLPQEKQTDVEQQIQVKNPVLWSLETPVMYKVVSVVKINRKEIDRYETPFGIRTIKIDADKGFFINGKNIKLKGMNLHQDAGALGTAVPDRSYERRLEILKEFGCNAIRCSHNPPSPEFLDFCDRIGFVVIDEAFDKWTSYYYKAYFKEWWKKDLSGMILRDRNHPSVVIWSAGNELAEANDTTNVSTARAKMLVDYIHQTEPTRPVSISIAPAYEKNRPYNRSGFLDVFDIVGYNYMEPKYIADKKAFPKRIIYGTEVFPFYRGNFDNMRDYNPDNPWYDVEKNDFVLGQFLWAGVDYLGESAGWPSKGWSTSPFDECMFEKPRAAFHRSVWNPQPVVRIAVADQSLNIDAGKDHWGSPLLAAHWNFPQYAGYIIEVQTINNCEEVELWINGASMGRRKTANYSNNTIVWYVPYKAGKIKATGYNNGIEVAEYELNTAGKPAKIVLQADREILAADGQDLSHITILLMDEKGVVVPDNDLQITFEVTGEGKLIGLDNGDLRSDEPFKGYQRITYFGKALAVVQASRNSGKITVRATADGLPENRLILNSK